MKDSKQRTFGSTATTATTATMDVSNNKRIFLKLAAREILKKLNSGSSYQDLLLLRRRLRQYYFLYFSKLNINVRSSSSTSPNLHLRMAHREGAVEMELEPHECLPAEKETADDHNGGTAATPNTITRVERMNPEDIMMMQMREYEADEPYKEILSASTSSLSSRLQFMPSIKIRKKTEDSILIDTVVQKDVSPTSTLFGVLEEEKLDIVFERQYRTETQVSHTIQVKVRPDYDLHDLENKLRTWAGFST
ncbi:uncharacterized protein LOC113300575 isoform X2 [Papaver somniferum]|uniref:uncharacterized protein LOC113300575 isoform X2 n=1 Tax=Papaver somniferum TaxID=3469 RepID=UPI000E705DAD|nr:uncharacterized protein LOC113300575 isoform X2 [Papaver somniferum]